MFMEFLNSMKYFRQKFRSKSIGLVYSIGNHERISQWKNIIREKWGIANSAEN